MYKYFIKKAFLCMELLGQRIRTVDIFITRPNHLPKKGSLNLHTHQNAIDIVYFPESSPALDIINLFNLCESLELLLLNLHSLIWMRWTSFCLLTVHFISFYVKCLIYILYPFSFWLFSFLLLVFRSSSFILNIKFFNWTC